MKRCGLSLTEMIVTLGILIIVAVVTLPTMLSDEIQDMETRQNTAVSDLNNSLNLAKTELGLLPMNFGPAQALEGQLQSKQFGINVPIPAACVGQAANGMTAVEAGDSGAELNNDTYVVGFRNTWDNSSIVSGADVVCLAVDGLDSNVNETFLVTLRRRESTINPTSDVVIASAQNRSTDTSGVSTTSGTEDPGTETDPGTVSPGAPAPTANDQCNLFVQVPTHWTTIPGTYALRMFSPAPYGITAKIYEMPARSLVSTELVGGHYAQFGQRQSPPVSLTEGATYTVELCGRDYSTNTPLACQEQTVVMKAYDAGSRGSRCDGAVSIPYDYVDPNNPLASNPKDSWANYYYSGSGSYPDYDIPWNGIDGYFPDNSTATTEGQRLSQILMDLGSATTPAQLDALVARTDALKAEWQGIYGTPEVNGPTDRFFRDAYLQIQAKRLGIPRILQHEGQIRVNVPYNSTAWAAKLASLPADVQANVTLSSGDPTLDDTSNVVLINMANLDLNDDPLAFLERLIGNL